MNRTDLNLSSTFSHQAVTRNSTLWPTAFHKQANYSDIYEQYLSTEGPTTLDERDLNTIIGVVVFAMLVTLGVIAYGLYQYMCRNKGAYRTTGEPAPEDYFYDESHSLNMNEKKEYFI